MWVPAPSGGQLTTCGDAEVYVRIGLTNNTFRYLSGPLNTPVDVSNVANLRLGMILPAGTFDPATLGGPTTPVTEVRYRAMINAHLVYEVL